VWFSRKSVIPQELADPPKRLDAKEESDVGAPYSAQGLSEAGDDLNDSSAVSDFVAPTLLDWQEFDNAPIDISLGGLAGGTTKGCNARSGDAASWEIKLLAMLDSSETD
jgi:hypothetical protein